jgi:hypothetical protein
MLDACSSPASVSKVFSVLEKFCCCCLSEASLDEYVCWSEAVSDAYDCCSEAIPMSAQRLADRFPPGDGLVSGFGPAVDNLGLSLVPGPRLGSRLL